MQKIEELLVFELEFEFFILCLEVVKDGKKRRGRQRGEGEQR